MEMFQSAGFQLIDEDSWFVNIDDLKVASRYSHMDKCDLECRVLRVLFQKPGRAEA